MKSKKFKLAAIGISMITAMSFMACGSDAASTPPESPQPAETEAVEQTKESAEESGNNSGGKKVSIVLATNWGEGDSKYDYFYPVYEKFKEEVSDTIDITLETYTTEDYKTKIKTQTAAGNLPDVFTYWGGGLMTDMQEAGLLLNADRYFEDSESTDREDFLESSFEYYIAGDGNTYGIPIESTRGILIANAELFEEYGLDYPTTYEELLACGEVFRANDIIPMAIGSNGGTPSEFFYSEIYNQYEGGAQELESLPSGGAFATDNALKVAEVIQDMISNKLFPEDTVTNGGWGPSLQLYTDRKAAMTYTYPWMFEAIPEDIQEASTIIPIPQMPDSTVDSSTIQAGFTVYGFLINKESYEDPAKKEAMIKVCDFLASDELTNALVESGMVPCKDVEVPYDSQKLIMQKTIDYSADKNLCQVHYTKMPSASAITEMDSGLDELFINAITPQEFIDKVQSAVGN